MEGRFWGFWRSGVFSNNSELKVKTKTPVVYIGQFSGVIKKYKIQVFQEKELEQLVEKLKNFNIATRKNEENMCKE